MTDTAKLSIVIPAKNEAASLGELLQSIRAQFTMAEIIVVNDCSDDDTVDICQANGALVLSHPYSMGNGAAIKTGVRGATGEVVVCMDADGQHDPSDIARLLAKFDEGFDMVVGARGTDSQATVGRSLANRLYNKLASWMVGHHVTDLTSGFRAARTEKFREFLHLLPNGFSYPTTITMAFFRAGYPVAYVPIHARGRAGKSHIRPLQDGTRFLLIIFRVGTLYSPLKIFVPISAFFFLSGLAYYIYTFLTAGRFTNMASVLFTTSVIVFLIGLVSEQITSLQYHRKDS
ncbi:MAG: glycosyltransferase family 2 protein [Sulfuricaulis sp.]